MAVHMRMVTGHNKGARSCVLSGSIRACIVTRLKLTEKDPSLLVKMKHTHVSVLDL